MFIKLNEIIIIKNLPLQNHQKHLHNYINLLS
jgi:hypothetical protein